MGTIRHDLQRVENKWKICLTKIGNVSNQKMIIGSYRQL